MGKLKCTAVSCGSYSKRWVYRGTREYAVPGGIRESSMEKRILRWILRQEWLAGRQGGVAHWGPVSSSAGRGCSEHGEAEQEDCQEFDRHCVGPPLINK